MSTQPSPPSEPLATAAEEHIPDYLSMLDVYGRSYVVAGAGQGMGRQVCHALAQAGAASILCVDIDPVRAELVAGEIACGVPLSADVTNSLECDAIAAAAERLPNLSGLVDVIGAAIWGPLLAITEDDWTRQLDLNLRQAVLLSQRLGRLLTKSGGTMVFVSSVSAMSGAPNHAAYGAGKAGLSAWVQSLAVELGPAGVRANAIAPGAILTPRTAPMLSADDLEGYASISPLNRMGSTSDIAAAALYLSSPLSGYVTGVTLVVDGGIGSTFRYGGLRPRG